MGYRGDDLDLRTPQAAPGDLAVHPAGDLFTTSPRPRASARGAPIWVDETVLDCCNHAFDVASAHRAAEVRLEHLIYALTRIEEGAEALEAHGVRVAGLRREAATAIATEVPAVLANGKTMPQRSEALEEVLRLAATYAYRRQAPVSAADIVHVLLDSGAAFAGLERLLPGIARAPAALAESFDVETVRERLRGAPRGRAPDLASLAPPQAFAQNARIDAIEQAIRDLTTELANERKIISGVLQDLQRELMAQREDTSRLGGLTQDKVQAVFGERLHSLEQAFLAARNPAGGDLQERLAVLERTLAAEITMTRSAIEALVAKPALDLTPLARRIEVIEEAVLSTDTADRLKALEDAVAAERERAKAAEEALAAAVEALPARILDPLAERLAGQHAATSDGLADANRRLDSLGETLSGHAAQLGDTLTQGLSELQVDLAKVTTNQHTLAGALDAQAQDTASAFATLAARIGSLEQAAAKPVDMLQALASTVDKMHKVTVERYYRRNRFWYWLFGTDDWLAASWPSQSARVAEELRAIKQ